ncbi:lipoprotein [Burkholderiaceae bacterium FT117]|uniref:LPS translocon maturation chaperone LptM n=1 Tax=Zeimonas sediminis TaxID=2944268 RepID=UPI002342D697|nr:lipoprotein [Zeimonas sediminis]MCM5570878.1 lipoprotein [Zeimonas sediminis]
MLPSRCAILAALAGALVLAGCGQRGPLYLPEQAPKKSQAQRTDGPGPAVAQPTLPAPRS